MTWLLLFLQVWSHPLLGSAFPCSFHINLCEETTFAVKPKPSLACCSKSPEEYNIGPTPEGTMNIKYLSDTQYHGAPTL